MSEAQELLPMNDTTVASLTAEDRERLRPLYPRDARLVANDSPLESRIDELELELRDARHYIRDLEQSLADAEDSTTMKLLAKHLYKCVDSMNKYREATTAEDCESGRGEAIEAVVDAGLFLANSGIKRSAE